MSDAKNLNDPSVSPITTVNGEYLLLVDPSNAKVKKITLANFKAALLNGMDLGAMYEGVFIMCHRNQDNLPLLWRPDQWTAQQTAGEVADGVAVIEGGRILVVAPTDAGDNGLYWASENISGGGYTTSDRLLAQQDFAGKANTAAQITHAQCQGATYAPGFCAQYARVNANSQGLTAGKWWLPSLGELFMMFANLKKINYALSLITGATQIPEAWHWSSTEYSATYAWTLSFTNGYQNYRNKSTNRIRVRPVSAFIA